MLPLELQKIKALKDQATTIAKRQPTVSLLPMVSELIRKGKRYRKEITRGPYITGSIKGSSDVLFQELYLQPLS